MPPALKMAPVVATVLSSVLVAIALSFSFYRGRRLKNVLAQLWGERRREILQLETENGFYFFMELLLRYSARLLSVSVVLGLVVAVLSPASIVSLAGVVSVGIAYRAAVLWFISRHRAHTLGDLMRFDGYGSYWRARGDWLSREHSARSMFLASITVLLAAILILLKTV